MRMKSILLSTLVSVGMVASCSVFATTAICMDMQAACAVNPGTCPGLQVQFTYAGSNTAPSSVNTQAKNNCATGSAINMTLGSYQATGIQFLGTTVSLQMISPATALNCTVPRPTGKGSNVCLPVTINDNGSGGYTYTCGTPSIVASGNCS